MAADLEGWGLIKGSGDLLVVPTIVGGDSRRTAHWAGSTQRGHPWGPLEQPSS